MQTGKTAFSPYEATHISMEFLIGTLFLFYTSKKKEILKIGKHYYFKCFSLKGKNLKLFLFALYTFGWAGTVKFLKQHSCNAAIYVSALHWLCNILQ